MFVNQQQLENLLTFALLKEREELWQEDWDSVLEYIIYESRIPLSSRAIERGLKDTFSYSVLSRHQLEMRISQLVQGDRIERAGRHQFQLAQSRRDEITSRIKQNRKVFQDFEKAILARIQESGSSIDPFMRVNVNRAVKAFLSVFLPSQSIASLAHLAKGIAEEHIQTFDAHIRKSGAVFAEGPLRDVYIQAMLDSVVDDRFAAFFWRGLQNLICLEIMRLDPAIEDFRKLFLDDPVVYLDANFVISLLLPGEETNHEIAKLACSEMQRLHIIPRVTKASLLEVMNLIEDAQNIMFNRTEPPEETTNAFVNDYKLSAEAKPMSWTQYAVRFVSMKHTSDCLKEEYSIETEEVDFALIDTQNDLPAFKEAVERAWSTLRGWKKSEEAAEHDALMLLLIRGLRPPKGQSGTMSWFVSFDLSLGLLSRSLQTEPQDRPLAVMADSWVQTLSVFPSIRTERSGSLEEIMMEYVVSRWTTALPALDRKRTQEILSTLENAPRDFYELLQIAEDIVINERITAPTVKRLKSQVRDYNGAVQGIRGYMLEKAHEKLAQVPPPPIPMLLRYRIGLTVALVLAGGAVGYLVFRVGGDRFDSPMIIAYVADFLVTLILMNGLWESKVTKALLRLARLVKEWL